MSRARVEIMLDRVEWKAIDGELPKEGLYATHVGELDLIGGRLKCYVLNDGRRVFDADDVRRFLGERDSAAEQGEAK